MQGRRRYPAVFARKPDDHMLIRHDFDQREGPRRRPIGDFLIIERRLGRLTGIPDLNPRLGRAVFIANPRRIHHIDFRQPQLGRGRFHQYQTSHHQNETSQPIPPNNR